MKKPIIIIFLVLLVDQLVKIWVKTHMYIGESIHVLGEKFQIYFIENNGMAFGMELGETNYSKLVLSIVRILAAIALTYWLFSQLKKKTPLANGLVVSMSLIIAGAVGNIIDSMFYGLVFNASPEGLPVVAEFMPASGGYAGFLQGQVVDMLYFPLFTIENMPEWAGGGRFTFFNAIFNIADAAITTGILMMIVFQKRYWKKPEPAVIVTSTNEPAPKNIAGDNEDKVN